MARVLMAGTFDPDFHRNRRLRRLLDLGGHEVTTCRVELWGIDRPEIPQGGKLRMLARALVAYPLLLWRFVRAPRADLVLIAHPGWFDVLVLAPFARLRRMPILFDIQFALHDSVVADRGLASRESLLGRFCALADRLSLKLPDRAIADTPAHAEFFTEHADLPPGKTGIVWLGTDAELFHPRPEVEPVERRAMFHGTFIPNQGVDTIVRAAKLLERDGVEVRVIGTGQEQAAVDRLVAELRPANLELVGPVPLERIPDEIAAASVCLGIFGTTERVCRVVPNKLYECLAVGRPVLTAESPTMREAFRDGEVALCEAGDPEALAAEVRDLVANPERREAIARAGHERYLTDYSEEPLRRLLDAEIEATIAARR
jgi:glycosyltransferase involved in cell wall biosynthesis